MIVKGTCLFRWSGFRSTESEACWFWEGWSWTPRGDWDMLWAGSAAAMIDVGASAFILHDHPVKGYFTASETFLGKTTIQPPGPTR